MTITDAIRGRLVVSVQAHPGDPLRRPEHMAAMAASVARAPIAGIRAQGVADLRAIRQRVDLPLIGLWKDGEQGVFITPTAAHAAAVARVSDIVAMDATARPRPDGRLITESFDAVHAAGRLVMADVSTIDEGVAAAASGADFVSTTLSGYTQYSPQSLEPDLELVAGLTQRIDVPVAAEGRIWTPEQARAALDAGAWTVIVGSAITRPADIATRFAAAVGLRPAGGHSTIVQALAAEPTGTAFTARTGIVLMGLFGSCCSAAKRSCPDRC